MLSSCCFILFAPAAMVGAFCLPASLEYKKPGLSPLGCPGSAYSILFRLLVRGADALTERFVLPGLKTASLFWEVG